jgi:putative tryptophan/tyrosine transport system substrate-binding protein
LAEGEPVRRRAFITLVGGATLGWPLTARAQNAATKVWRVGYVSSYSSQVVLPDLFDLGKRLEDLGYVDGKNIIRTEPKVIEDTIGAVLPNVDILVVWTTLLAVIARRLTTSVPTVFLSVSTPVEVGLVKSLAHPDGNMTGVTFEATPETYAKRLQMLREIVPTLKRLAVLGGRSDPNVPVALASMESATRGLTSTLFEFEADSDLPALFNTMQSSGADGLIVIASALTFSNFKSIAELSLVHRLPGCYPHRESVVAGGLISLGPDLAWITRQGAAYVDKIIRGAKPGNLPVEQPTRYQVFVNLKTAKALGLDVPPALLARADEVIE